MIYNVGGGAGGALVHINVNYSEAFIGETITLTNGTETHTFIGDNTLSKVINCQNLGEWTVSCGEYEASVDTNYYGKYSLSLQSRVTLDLTVYSASNDTVYFYPNNDTSETAITLCTTNASGQGSATLEIPPEGTMITFYSTIAKDTTTGTNAYAKSINLSADTDTLNVMPDHTIYWYGYDVGNWTATNTKVGGTYAITPNITRNTNNFVVGMGSTYGSGTYETVANLTGYTNIKGHFSDNTIGAGLYTKYSNGTTISDITTCPIAPDNIGKVIIGVICNSASFVSVTCHAIWLE